MNEIKVLDVLMMQYADYFVNKEGYMLLQVTNLEGNYLWLLNPKNLKFPIVVLSTESFSSAYGHDDTFTAVTAKITEQFEVDDRRLELYFQDETGIPDIGYNFHREAISLGTIPTEEICNIYPGLKDVAKPIDTTSLPSQFTSLGHSINQGSNERIKAVAKEKYLNNREFKKPIATYVIMAICILVYLLKIYLANVQGITDDVTQVIMLGGYYKGFVLGMNEWFRLLTSGFVHVDLIHFLMNMFAFYTIGSLCENIFGAKKMLIVLLGSIVYGNLLVLIVQGNSVCNGLSGGIYGLFALLGIYLLKSGAFKNRRLLSRVISIILINIGISLLPDVSLYGHLGGFISGGFISSIIMDDDKWKSFKPHIIICFVILSGAMIYLASTAQLDVAYGLTDSYVADAFNKIGFTGYGRRILSRMIEYYTTHGF